MCYFHASKYNLNLYQNFNTFIYKKSVLPFMTHGEYDVLGLGS